ncbi:MAG: cell wall-active antibiotics response protein [Clostridiales bacterium]|nr:cell wall-active antibiotics response protein [Clostridiales bacterium]
MRNRISNTIWGLVFIVLGVGIAGDIMGHWEFRVFFPGWWTLFIIIPCLVSIIRKGIGIWNSAGFLIGLILLITHYVDIDIEWWRLIVPAILIVIGLQIIFRGATRKPIRLDDVIRAEIGPDMGNIKKEDYNAIFSSNNIPVTGQFVGANLNAIFGAVVLDLRNAVISSDIEITATAVFGGIDIHVPPGINVKVNNIPIFGGVSNKSGYRQDQGAYTIYLDSTTMFGGIDIK